MWSKYALQYFLKKDIMLRSIASRSASKTVAYVSSLLSSRLSALQYHIGLYMDFLGFHRFLRFHFLGFSWILLYSHTRTLLSLAQRSPLSLMSAYRSLFLCSARGTLFLYVSQGKTLMSQAPRIDLYLLCFARRTLISYVSQWGPIYFSSLASRNLICYAPQADLYVTQGESICFSCSTRRTHMFLMLHEANPFYSHDSQGGYLRDFTRSAGFHLPSRFWIPPWGALTARGPDSSSRQWLAWLTSFFFICPATVSYLHSAPSTMDSHCALRW